MTRPWVLLPLVSSVVLLGSAAPAQATSSTAGCQPDRRATVYSAGEAVTPSTTFEPCLVDTGMATGESDLAIDRAGTLIRSVTTSPVGVAVSSDQGATWQSRPLPAGTSTSIATGYLDPTTNRYFYTAYMGDVSFTDDEGRTWQPGTFDSPLRQDWPKMFSGRPVVARTSGYPTNVYYCDWEIPAGVVDTVRCFKSTDGGTTFTTTGPNPYNPGPCLSNPTATPGVIHGRGIVDPRDGSILLPATECGELEVAVSRDEGATWTIRKVSEARLPDATSAIQAVTDNAYLQQTLGGAVNPVPPTLGASEQGESLGMDGSGRLYITWIDGTTFLPYLSTSPDQGQTWTAPRRYSAPGVLQAVLPAINVTPAGRVGLSYMGTTDKATYTGYLTVTDDAASAAPTFQTAAVTRPGHPLMNSLCCWTDGAQEYTSARWGADGSLWAAFPGYTPSGAAEGWVGRLRPVTAAVAPAPTVKKPTLEKPVVKAPTVQAPAGALAATGSAAWLPLLGGVLVILAAVARRRLRRNYT